MIIVIFEILPKTKKNLNENQRAAALLFIENKYQAQWHIKNKFVKNLFSSHSPYLHNVDDK